MSRRFSFKFGKVLIREKLERWSYECEDLKIGDGVKRSGQADSQRYQGLNGKGHWAG